MNAVLSGPGGTTISISDDQPAKLYRMKRRFYVGSELRSGSWQVRILQAASPQERSRIEASGRKVYRSFAAAEPEYRKAALLLARS